MEVKEKVQDIETESGYIKLYKSETQKGIKYNWEIKFYTSSDKEEFEKIIKQIEELNDLMLSRFCGDLIN